AFARPPAPQKRYLQKLWFRIFVSTTQRARPAARGRPIARDRDRDSRHSGSDRAQSPITRPLPLHEYSPRAPSRDPTFPIRAIAVAFHLAAARSHRRRRKVLS